MMGVYKLYTLDGKFVGEADLINKNFTGIVHLAKSIIWYLNGNYHREDGPAIEWSDGTKQWFINDKRHRLDGPAIEYSDGRKSWFVNGKLHRVDGAAHVQINGSKQWYINGEIIPCNTDEEFLLLVDIMKLKGLL